MEKRHVPGIFLALALTTVMVVAERTRAAETPIQVKFLVGERIPPPDPRAANSRAIQTARELQAGPHPGESPDAYGRRAQAVAVSLGLSGQDAAKAGALYRQRALWQPAMRNGGGFLRPGQGPSQAALNASNKARAVMRHPDWPSATADGAGPLMNPDARSQPRWAPVKTPPLLMALPKPKRTVVPAPEKPAREEGSALSRAAAGFRLPAFFSQSRSERIETLAGWSADYSRRADALTERSTGDSASGWFRRKLLQTQSAFYAAGALVNDPAAMKQAARAAGDSIGRGMFPEKIYETRHPGTWKSAAINALMDNVGPKGRIALSLGSIGVRQASDDAAGAYRAVAAYNDRGSFWSAADAVTATGVLGLDLASVTPAGVGRFGLRQVALAPRTFLKTSGIRRELAATLEANYRRTAELNQAYREGKRTGAPKARLAAIRDQSWELYHQNAAMQTEIPALRDYFKNAKPGDPASPEVMQVVAANMGGELETVSGVRLANYSSLQRDMRAGGIKPNPGKALDDGTMTGSAAHLLRDGSAHMVSVADRLTGGLVMLMTGYADASRATKTMSGIMYEFEGVPNAARVPLPREVFSDVLSQRELMVPEVPLRNIKRVRSWRAEVNPANESQLIFRYTEPLVPAEGLNADALVASLKSMPHPNSMRVEIPGELDPFINR